ncbi:MAG: hypothetical protein KJO21_08005 [Verrucomicrobiae bacterium]|nr:hypothetical protein [Verrucomicrobiae bacterium]NNJ43417.1 hypothetical protein [Akkermansiaceae bacterium]
MKLAKYGTPSRVVLSMMVIPLSLLSAHADNSKGAGEDNKSSGKNSLVKVKHSSLYKNSHIISNNKAHTIVPKRSIVFLPARIKSRVSDQPNGKFILWPSFLKMNRDWIWTFEVTLDQAKGITPIPKGKLKDFSKLNRMVVALYRGNPISILPPKKPSSKDAKRSK